jgi:hypothetical protein
VSEDDPDFEQLIRERIERVYIELDKEMAANISAYREAQVSDRKKRSRHGSLYSHAPASPLFFDVTESIPAASHAPPGYG